MTARLDVPALLREAGRRSSPPDLTEEEAAFLIRLADAVEAWQGTMHPTGIANAVTHTRHESRVLALLRGEVAP